MTVFERIPGYALLRRPAYQVAGGRRESTWKPALFQTDEALVPAFMIENLDDGRYTVFVPSIPMPFAGAVYVLDPDDRGPSTRAERIAQWIRSVAL